MITIRRAGERASVQGQEWISFDRSAPDLLGADLGALEAFREGRLPPRSAIRSTTDAEIITYVREGTLAYEDSTGRAGLIHAGEFQRMTAGASVRYEETNTSPTQWAHVFQVRLRASVGIAPGHEQRRFTAAERRGVLCLVASPSAENGSLELHGNARIYSTLLLAGQHVIHELVDGRCAWLHIVEGSVRFHSLSLQSGDGAGVVGEDAVSLTAETDSEVLLLDLAQSTSTPQP